MSPPGSADAIRKPSRRMRIVARWSAATISFASIAIAACYALPWAAAHGRTHDSPASLPRRAVGLVLGTSPLVAGGRKNLFFEYRMDAAAEAFHLGKIQHLLLSGDNRRRDYSEPAVMRDALLRRGVPAAAMTLDYAGFRTLDSVVRAKEVFGATRVTVISQRFHNERAILIARARGLDAIALNARSPAGTRAARVFTREIAARAKAALDLFVLRTAPKFLGEKVPLPTASGEGSPRRRPAP